MMNSLILKSRKCIQLQWLFRRYRVQGYSTETQDIQQDHRGSFAKAFDKLQLQIKEEGQVQQATFAHLLRNSKFIDLGDVAGKVVQGSVFKIVDNDVYVDLGCKLHCVCAKPKQKPSGYVRGARVRVLLRDLELSSKFLGYEKDITLLEAEGVLLGLAAERPI